MRNLLALLVYAFFMIYILLVSLNALFAADISAKCRNVVQKADQVIEDCKDVVSSQDALIDAQKGVIETQDAAIAAKDAEIERLDEPTTKWIFGLSGSTLTLLLVILL